MHSASTNLTVYMAPKDAYSYEQFKRWHAITKRKWSKADVIGCLEIKVLENNKLLATKQKASSIVGYDTTGTTLKKSLIKLKYHQDIVGDSYYDYYLKFSTYSLGWWGLPLKSHERTAVAANKARNIQSIPNPLMLDVSVNLQNNSMMRKLYLEGMTYDEAVGTTSKSRSSSAANITKALTEFNINTGYDTDAAKKEALRSTEIVVRNMALITNPPQNNPYRFLCNYYNRYIDPKMREMMKIDLNFWFLKEAMTYNPNLSFYVMCPGNKLSRIYGVVGKRDHNVVIKMESIKVKMPLYSECAYSVSKDTAINIREKQFVPLDEIAQKKTVINNLRWGPKPIEIDRRHKTETFFDLVLSDQLYKGNNVWIDRFHNCWTSPDYSKAENIRGLDIIV